MHALVCGVDVLLPPPTHSPTTARTHHPQLAGVYKADGRTADAKAARRTVVKKCKALGDKDPTIWVQVSVCECPRWCRCSRAGA